jgi:hypothetical protein
MNLDLAFGISEFRNFTNHVDNATFLIDVEWNVVEWRDKSAILFNKHTVVQ